MELFSRESQRNKALSKIWKSSGHYMMFENFRVTPAKANTFWKDLMLCFDA